MTTKEKIIDIYKFMRPDVPHIRYEDYMAKRSEEDMIKDLCNTLHVFINYCLIETTVDERVYLEDCK